MLKSVINVERKFIDQSGSYTQGSTAQTVSLTQIGQGVTASTRNGLSVKATSMNFRSFVRINPSSTGPVNFRVAIVIDTMNAGTVPTYADVFESTSIVAPLNKENTPRFKVLCDKVFRLTPGASANGLQEFHCYKKLIHHIRYSGGLTTDFREGNMFCVTQSDDNTNLPTHQYYSRVNYIDN